MRRSSRRPQPPASGPRISGAQSSDMPLPVFPVKVYHQFAANSPICILVNPNRPTFRHLPFPSHAHAAGVVHAVALVVVAATVGCGTLVVSK